MTMQRLDFSAALRGAAEQALRAPSIHNTQPWRLELGPKSIDLFADRSRQLLVIDPLQRELTLSCGCALFNIRASLAATGVDAEVARMPDPAQPDLLARVRAIGHIDPATIDTLDQFIPLRRTNRRRFEPNPVDPAALAELCAAAAAEQISVFVVSDIADRVVLAWLTQRADIAQRNNPAYLDEVHRWTTNDPERVDGVQLISVPKAGGNVDDDTGEDSDDDLPIREFDSTGLGCLPSDTASSKHQCLVLLGTASDNPIDWLKTGEALQRLWLEATRRGYVLSPLSQVIEVPWTRDTLRTELPIGMYPHVLIRVGHAGATPQSHRRSYLDVVTEIGQRDTGNTEP